MRRSSSRPPEKPDSSGLSRWQRKSALTGGRFFSVLTGTDRRGPLALGRHVKALAGRWAGIIVALCCCAMAPARGTYPAAPAQAEVIPPPALERAARLVLIPAEGLHVGISDLEAVEPVNERAALRAALERAWRQQLERELVSEKLAANQYRPIEDPAEVAHILRLEYGPGSLLARGAGAVAALAEAAERGSQAPLDRLNLVTATVARSGSRVLGLKRPPSLRLRSRLTTKEAAVGISTRW